jgi:hypothetical protein
MLPRCVVVCLAAAAFVATTALMPTGAPAAGRGAAANVRNRRPGTGRPMLKAGICPDLPAATCR